MPSAKYLFFWNIYGTKNSVIITSFLHLTLILNRLGLVTKGHRSQKMLISHIRLRSYETGLLSFTYFRLFTRRLQAGILILVVVIFMFFFFKESVWKNDGFGWANIRSVHVSSCITWQTLKKNKWLHDLLTSWGNFCDDVWFVCFWFHGFRQVGIALLVYVFSNFHLYYCLCGCYVWSTLFVKHLHDNLYFANHND